VNRFGEAGRRGCSAELHEQRGVMIVDGKEYRVAGSGE
jgi:hypothetical protein